MQRGVQPTGEGSASDEPSEENRRADERDPESTAPSGAPSSRLRVRATIAYDGAEFHGFAANHGVATVAGTLTERISTVVREPVELVGAGRTDTGVHAWGQVVSFDVPGGVNLPRLQRSVNSLCAPSIVMRDIAVAPDDFHARFSALWRRYRYTLYVADVPNPFLARTAWHVPPPLDLDGLRLACDPIIGEHDFTSFCRKHKVAEGEVAPSMVRRVIEARWSEHDDGILQFQITATAFCHQMVRSIVGTMVDVGLGRRHAGEILSMLRAKDRSATGTVAPPHGLCLWEVGYPSTGDAHAV
jgi:tRNA pseudouridine38-40 synthase